MSTKQYYWEVNMGYYPQELVGVVKEKVLCIRLYKFKYFLMIYQDQTHDLFNLMIV